MKKWGNLRKTHPRSYVTWNNMNRRCTSMTHKNGWYIKRGITVCQRWKDSFINFVEDMGERPEGKFIDRINNDKGYYPGNCRWATTKEQLQNCSLSKRWIIYGKSYGSLRDAVAGTGIPMRTLRQKIDRKYPGFSKESVYG